MPAPGTGRSPAGNGPTGQAAPRRRGHRLLQLPEDLDTLRRTTAARKAAAEEPHQPPTVQGRSAAPALHRGCCG